MKRPKLSRMEKALFAAPLLVVALALLFQLWLRPDGFDDILRRLSGPNAVEYGLDTVLSTKPMLAIAQSGKPFWAITESYPAENFMVGMVRTPKGDLYNLGWQRPKWFSKGHVVWIFRIRNLKSLPDGNYKFDPNNMLSEAEERKLLQR